MSDLKQFIREFQWTLALLRFQSASPEPKGEGKPIEKPSLGKRKDPDPVSPISWRSLTIAIATLGLFSAFFFYIKREKEQSECFKYRRSYLYIEKFKSIGCLWIFVFIFQCWRGNGSELLGKRPSVADLTWLIMMGNQSKVKTSLENGFCCTLGLHTVPTSVLKSWRNWQQWPNSSVLNQHYFSINCLQNVNIQCNENEMGEEDE